MFLKLHHRFVFVALGLLLSLCASAQNFLPPVTNYNSTTYNAASQNWGLSTDSDGTLYAANNDGLLRFDGERWEVFTLPNKTAIRSVFCIKDRIYTGSYEEFGYWTEDAYGSLQYTSLSKLISTTFANEEFWQITAWQGAIVFRSFGNLYVYNGQTITTERPQTIITAMQVHNDKLLLGSNYGEIFEFDQDRFQSYAENSISASSIIELSTYDNQLLAGTRRQGIYSLKNGVFSPWGSEALKAFLAVNELNKIQPVDQDLVILGTVKGGILYYNPKTGALKNHFRQNGLQNNTVLSLHKDRSKIWIGLDNGIDVVVPNTAIQYLLDNTGQLGAVYDIASLDGSLYVGSNTGVHKITEQGIFFIPGSQGQVWSLTKIEGRLFVNHNLGLFELKNDALKLVSGISGSFGLTAIPQSSSYFNTTYNGLRKYTLTKGALLNQPLSEGGGAPVEHVIFEDQNYFWAAHPYKGFYRAQLNNQQQRIENKESYIDYEALAAYKTEIHKLEGEIAFYNAGSWYRYNSISDTLEEFEDLKAYTAYALLSNQDNSYWFKNRNGAGLIYTNFSSDSIFIEEPLLESRIIKNYEKIVKRNDSIYYITLNEGFARLNLAQLQRNNANQNLSTPLLNGIKTNNKALALDQSIEIPFKEAGQIEIAIAAPQLHNPKFFYSLSNGLSGQSNGTLNFQNLQAGSYTLKIWPELNGQRGDQPLNVTFLIKRPWYLSNLMIVVYVLLLFGVIFLVAYINKQKLNKHRRELEERLVKEQERKNQLAERNNLLEEINAKRKELANTTYLAAKRNSSLIDIKNDLEAVKDKGDNQKKVNSIQNKINHIIDAKDNWKVFETTFKEINNDFFQQLLENHPTLSSKDLKLCAYLKMNLSTKEIAPLMAISVRGVEIHRYRLRKKLNLKSGKNLSKYLIKNY